MSVVSSAISTSVYPTDALLDYLDTDVENGLSERVAEQRLLEDGQNQAGTDKSVNTWTLFFAQFKSSVVLLLLVSAGISIWLKEYFQTAGILAALLINAGIGFYTEYRAKVSLAALAKLTGSCVRVRRSGREVELPVLELVRGDIVLLEPGVRVPADLRVIECASFSVDESPLTGESVPVFKAVYGPDNEDEDSSLLYSGSAVLSGRAIGVVIATGAKTKIGKIGLLIQETIAGETPLTHALETLGRQLTYLVILLCVCFGCLGIIRGESVGRMLQAAVALAVAAIPEGLPVIATLALASGIRSMIKHKALVRRLPAVETLGCTTIICTDKTGTLTENKMLVTDVVLFKDHLQLSGNGYEPLGELTRAANESNAPVDPAQPLIKEFMTAICLCNDARLEFHSGDEGWHIHGDPTEGCLKVAASKCGIVEKDLLLRMPRLFELPFDLNRKRMSTVHTDNNQDFVLFCKGSPGLVIPLCADFRSSTGRLPLDDNSRRWFLEYNAILAAKGLRVLAVATRKLKEKPDALNAVDLEKDLTLLGLVAMADRPRQNVKDAIKICQKAGIRLVMLTGDQAATALAVARELGIIAEGVEESLAVLKGDQINALDDKQLHEALSKISVLARVTPELKLEIVKRLQQQGHIVAMSGDGVNDAPALRQSNIGIAMGNSGTDLARESSDLVITDDNFATIVKAVEQGRITYSNISKAVGYLLTATFSCVFAITLGLFVNSALFLQPLQLLYLNLIMHVFPGLGIVMQKQSDDVMVRLPRSPKANIMDGYACAQIAVRSILVCLAGVAAMFLNQLYFDAVGASTVVLATLSLALTFQSWSWLSTGTSTTPRVSLLNIPMLATTVINVCLLGLGLYWPPLQLVLNTVSLTSGQVCVVVSVALVSFFVSIPVKILAFGLENGNRSSKGMRTL